MVKKGFYIFMFLDVIGYTSIRIFSNDTCLIPDIKRDYEVGGIDYELYYAADDEELIKKCMYLVEKYNVSVRDMTGMFLCTDEFYKADDAFDKLKALLPEEWR